MVLASKSDPLQVPEVIVFPTLLRSSMQFEFLQGRSNESSRFGALADIMNPNPTVQLDLAGIINLFRILIPFHFGPSSY